MSYTISDAKIKPKNNVSQMIYSETNEYYTFNSDNNNYTWESERNIMERYSNIPSEDLEEWLTAVMNYINNYNSKLAKPIIKYEISEMRANAMYNYQKYINDVLVDEGWMDYGMVPKLEMDAWVSGVKNFRKKNNIPLLKDKINDVLKKIHNTRNLIKSPYDDDISGSSPNIITAIGYATTDLCKFPSKIIEAVKTGISTPIDKMKNTVMGLKKEINMEIHKSTDDYNIVVGPLMDPVIETVETQVNDRSDEDDLAEEYYEKKLAHELELIKARLERINEQYSSSNNYNNTNSNNSNNMDNGNDEDYNVIISSGNGYEIPSWMSTNINNAMKTRFTKGVPDQSIIDRYNDNKAFFFKTFQNYNVPTQLTVLSIIESNVVNISKENSATAKGMWQFIRLTAQDYGLLELALKSGLGEDYNKYNSKNYDIVSTYDKRDELEASTIAAAKLLRDTRKSRKKIYNWLLVAAAYNWGGGNVSKAITKAGSNATLWDVWKRMPLETRNYVCLIIGLCNYLGFSLDPLFE